MPDRQRHSRLSEVLSRLFPARSRTVAATAGRHRDAGQYEPFSREAGQGQGQWTPAAGPGTPLSHQARNEEWSPAAGPDRPLFRDARDDEWTPAAGPGAPRWDDDPQAAVTMEINRSAWDLTAEQERVPDHLDPMTDTMQLSRSALFRPPAEPMDPMDPTGPGGPGGAGGPSGPNSGPDTESASEPPPSRSVRPGLLEQLKQQNRRLAIGAAGIVAISALLALPPVRAQLRDSFTRVPQPYTALYFTSPPQVDGTVLTVPVSVRAVDTGRSAYSVRVWTVDAQGQVDDSRNADLSWDGQALSTVVSMPVNPAADYVWVSLGGSDETLHYKIAVA